MANKFVESAKRITRDTFDGDEGSIFWAIKMIYVVFMRAVDSVNNYFHIRRVEKMRREAAAFDDDMDGSTDNGDPA